MIDEVVVVVEITSPQQDQLMKVPLLCEIIYSVISDG